MGRSLVLFSFLFLSIGTARADVANLHCRTLATTSAFEDKKIEDVSALVDVNNPGIGPNSLDLLNGYFKAMTVQGKIQIQELPWTDNAISYTAPAIIRDVEPNRGDYEVDIFNITGSKFGTAKPEDGKSDLPIVKASIRCNLIKSSQP